MSAIDRLYSINNKTVKKSINIDILSTIKLLRNQLTLMIVYIKD